MRSRSARPNVPTKRSAVSSTILLGVFVLGMLSLVFVTIGVRSSNPIPMVVWIMFVAIFFGVLLVSRKSKRVTVGFPDGRKRYPVPDSQ